MKMDHPLVVSSKQPLPALPTLEKLKGKKWWVFNGRLDKWWVGVDGVYNFDIFFFEGLVHS